MFLKILKLENVGPFSFIDLEFKDRITIIIGDNGVGKSTIASPITAIWQNNINDLLPSTKDGAEKSSIEGIFDENKVIRVQYKKDPSSGKVTNQAISHQKHKVQQIPIIPCNPYRRFAKTSVAGPVKEPINRNKHTLNSQFAKNFTSAEDVTFQSWIVNRYFFKREKWGAKYKRELSYFSKISKQFFTDDYSISFRTVNRQMVPIFDTPFGETPFYSLSSGIQSIFFLIYNLISNLSNYYNESENIFQEKGLIIVDEIETHLHPKWQQSVVNGLSKFFPNCQFIITTHSPLVISSADKNQVLLLKYTNGNIDVEYIENTKGWLAEDIYSNFMGLVSSRNSEIEDDLEELELLLSIKFQKELHKAEKTKLTKLKNKLLSSLPPEDPIITLLNIKALAKSISK